LKFSEDDTDKFIEKLAKEFIQEKISKLNFKTQLYLWLNSSYVKLIMLKNDQEDLDKIFESQCKGKVETPTELE
jgi:hypothetical protein